MGFRCTVQFWFLIPSIQLSFFQLRFYSTFKQLTNKFFLFYWLVPKAQKSNMGHVKMIVKINKKMEPPNQIIRSADLILVITNGIFLITLIFIADLQIWVKCALDWYENFMHKLKLSIIVFVHLFCNNR